MKTVIEMARLATNGRIAKNEAETESLVGLDEVTRFAELVRADERARMATKQTEAMRLALEALEGWGKGFPDNWGDLDTEAVTALREALAQQALDKMAENARELGLDYEPAQQEPVAWMDGYRNIYSLEEKAAGCPEATIALVPMANHKKTSGSPIKELNCICGAVWEGDELVHLPRPPAQRKPLTDEEIIKCWGQVSGTRYGYAAFARAIEAKLKEKNT